MLDEVTFFYLKQLRCFADTVPLLILFRKIPRMNGTGTLNVQNNPLQERCSFCLKIPVWMVTHFVRKNPMYGILRRLRYLLSRYNTVRYNSLLTYMNIHGCGRLVSLRVRDQKNLHPVHEFHSPVQSNYFLNAQIKQLQTKSDFLKFQKRFFPSQVTTKKLLCLKPNVPDTFPNCEIDNNSTQDIVTRKYWQDHRHKYLLLDGTYDTVQKINLSRWQIRVRNGKKIVVASSSKSLLSFRARAC